jgi:hypothetical protein
MEGDTGRPPEVDILKIATLNFGQVNVHQLNKYVQGSFDQI